MIVLANFCFEFFRPKRPKMIFFKFDEKWTPGMFLVFLMKLQQHKVVKLTFIIFLGETLCWCFWTKGSQNEVFQVLWKINSWNFSDFLLEVKATSSLELTSMIYLGEILFCCFQVKRSQNGFSSLMKNRHIDFFFSFLAWSYRNIRSYNWT